MGVDVGQASDDHLRDLPVSGGGNCFSHSSKNKNGQVINDVTHFTVLKQKKM